MKYYSWRACGDANFYMISFHEAIGIERWFARIQLNGELTTPQQEAIVNNMCKALNEGEMK